MTNMSSVPWRWTQSEAMFDDPPMNLKGDEWTVDNCPEGYSMATTGDLTAIVNAIEPDAGAADAAQSLQGYALRHDGLARSG